MKSLGNVTFCQWTKCSCVAVELFAFFPPLPPVLLSSSRQIDQKTAARSDPKLDSINSTKSRDGCQEGNHGGHRAKHSSELPGGASSLISLSKPAPKKDKGGRGVLPPSNARKAAAAAAL